MRNFFLIYAAGNIVVTSFIMWKMLQFTKDDPLQDMKKEVTAKLKIKTEKRSYHVQSTQLSVPSVSGENQNPETDAPRPDEVI